MKRAPVFLGYFLLFLIGLVVLTSQGCGTSPSPVPTPGPGPGPAICTEGKIPVRLVATWSYDINGRVDLGVISKTLAFSNVVTVKQRLQDTGDLGAVLSLAKSRGAKLWAIAQGGLLGFEKDVNFILSLQATGDLVGAMIGPDEPDLSKAEYVPAKLTQLAQAFRARGVTVPLFINLSVAVGLPGGIGYDLIMERGVPSGVGIGIEAYHLTDARWRLTMGPAALDVLRITPPDAQIVLIPGVWQAPGQPPITEATAKAPLLSFSCDPLYTPYSPRIYGVIFYRGSTDRMAEDCLLGAVDIPAVVKTLTWFKNVNGL